ncbi:MAG: DinB family protein [Bacteroidota bacterium]|nr:DinB family protein [Bacteroidota bacterium]
MELKEHIKNMCLYNQWANEKLFGAIPLELADVEINSSFSSIRKTVYHLWDAETVWLERLMDKPLTPWPATANYTGTFAESFTYIKEQENTYIQFIEQADLSNRITYKNLKGIEFSSSFFEILSHVVNHSTFHRGQLVTMLRQAGVTQIPATDLIAYYRK